MDIDEVKITESIEYVTITVLSDRFTFSDELELTNKVEEWFIRDGNTVSVNLLDLDEVGECKQIVKFEVVTTYLEPIYYMR